MPEGGKESGNKMSKTTYLMATSAIFQTHQRTSLDLFKVISTDSQIPKQLGKSSASHTFRPQLKLNCTPYDWWYRTAPDPPDAAAGSLTEAQVLHFLPVSPNTWRTNSWARTVPQLSRDLK